MGRPKWRCWRSPGEGRAGPLIIYFSNMFVSCVFVVLSFLPAPFLFRLLQNFVFSFLFFSFLFFFSVGRG